MAKAKSISRLRKAKEGPLRKSIVHKLTICTACGRDFDRRRSWQRFCSAQCRSRGQEQDKRSPLLTKPCMRCSRQFKQTRAWQRFCSTKCRQDFHNDEMAKARSSSRQLKAA